MTTQPAISTDLNHVDEFVASRLTEMFGRDNGNSGWTLMNNGIFADKAQEERVIDALIRREVLYRCDNCRNTMSSTPFVCYCQDDPGLDAALGWHEDFVAIVNVDDHDMGVFDCSNCEDLGCEICDPAF